ncbi:MAG: hypothetical protein V1685_04685 [Parcubacteria group bacterium]
MGRKTAPGNKRFEHPGLGPKGIITKSVVVGTLEVFTRNKVAGLEGVRTEKANQLLESRP